MFNPNRINIHELTIEEPLQPSELPFDPERDITEEDWQGMKGELERRKQANEWASFSWRDMEMKILAAEEVKVTDKGLEINMRKNKALTSTVPPLPETKNF